MNKYFEYLNTGLPQDIQVYKDCGNFEKANELIDLRLQDENLPEAMKGSLLVQKEILRRIPYSFKYTFKEALEIAKKKIPDIKEEELQELVDKRKFEWVYINGEMHLVNSFLDTIKRDPNIKKRMVGYEPEKIENVRAWKVDQFMTKQGYMAAHIKVKQSIKLKDEFFKEGMTLKVHLPLARNNDYQSNVKVEEMFPLNGICDDDNAIQKTVYFEEVMKENHEFYVVYSYDIRYDYVKLDKPGIAKTYDFDVNEQYPHIAFTPFVKQITSEITSGITDPLEKARAIYDYITINCKYAFQPSYFLKDNIVETVLKNRRGDCGMFAITFITMCRCAGIPAVWESGLCTQPTDAGSHDWAKFYVEPYGWLYADPSFGIGALEHNFPKGRTYYFGNFDSYRTIINSGFEQEFTHPKKFFRHDPYDNQVGEIESEERGFCSAEFEENQETLEYIMK